MSALSLPAAAAPPYSGRVEVGVTAPAIPAASYRYTGANDRLTGDVFKLSPAADGKRYTLQLVSGATGIENPDVYFYTAGEGGGIGSVCTVDAADADGGRLETGTICPHPGEAAAWAVVVLRAGGARAAFTFSYTG